MSTESNIPTIREMDATPYVEWGIIEIVYTFDGMTEGGEAERGAARALAEQTASWLPILEQEPDYDNPKRWQLHDIDIDTDGRVHVWLNQVKP